MSSSNKRQELSGLRWRNSNSDDLPSQSDTSPPQEAAGNTDLMMPEVLTPTIIIEAKTKWKTIDWKECVQYRDLFLYLVLRDLTVLYKQTVLGVAWAILNPLLSMIVFTIIFGSLLKIPSDGIPYCVFSFAALLPWTYFAQSLTGASGSLIAGSGLLSKVYFPRVFLPMVPIVSKLVDLAVASIMMSFLMVYFRIAPSGNVVFLPMLILLAITFSAGVGLFLAALAVQYRDVRHALTFFIQVLMYAAPVVWPISKIPTEFRLLYGIYPMAGVIGGFRSTLTGASDMPWDLVGVGWLSALVCLCLGVLYFRRTERYFADLA